ncbi:GDSL esterase/lipase At1g28570 [Elaeis guineensis]|uniref:GDSL esterase/lipase At1g28570 n=1 Tax=Elaeis guineensis var. tenera TaxID=51953 RepID=A0A8N4IF79_ELAGV|nr:GDSL esterase/lipase At1g28570 [Elaeis guineensis]
MASSHHSLQFPLFTALLALLGTRLVVTYDTSILKSTFAAAPATCLTSIFSFGDSLADTGNLLHYLGDDAGPFAHLPYGETYFHNATGRFSDGRLIIDFIAQSLGLPLVPPYLAGTNAQDFRYGANFAVAGATALDNDFFRAKGLNVTWSEYSLVVQFNWFKQLLPSLCSTDSDCKGIISNSLFLVGEIGWNDHGYSFNEGRTADEIRTFIPNIIEVISSVIDDLIKLGAKTLVVPGIFPSGCVPVYLTWMQSEIVEDYDPDTGCIKWVNEFSAYHNQLLQNELDRIRRLHPHVTIIYADYYEALMSVFRSPEKFGFKKAPLDACCGGGGPYNVNFSLPCGGPMATVCKDPSKFVFWDDAHPTEAATEIVARGLLEGPYAYPPILQACSKVESDASQLQPLFHPTK